ncbi:hypothetical protein HYH03_002831 [Edaphochlamys debaryana]|uniref:Ankyrin repeat protein n=1 Tax=Edaphochlamys debaryana TaxID=47281 RepID=A0A835YCU8_9CHLO|nr:hypothetical protein HYH03_002831 [Edaphochlamys debaryana]|eukprot:KAG2499252.1 hypothetical protein HYH03_002831 [Edaphochlamys debaryana]
MSVVLKLYWDTPLAHAIQGGNRSVCEWCLAKGAERSWGAFDTAYRAGHTELAELLRPPGPIPSSRLAGPLLRKVAHGCDLATLGREWERVLLGVTRAADPADDAEGEGEGPDYDGEPSLQEIKDDALASAIGSPTPDWEAKAEFMAAKGAMLGQSCVHNASKFPGLAAVERLAWLKARGLDPRADMDLFRVAHAGNLEAVRWLLSQGVRSVPEPVQENLAYAAPLPALQLLLEEGVVTPPHRAVRSAMRRGSAGLPLLRWLVERYGEEAYGEPFGAAARNGDARTLRVLRRLGLDWGPPCLGVLAAAVGRELSLPTLRWMVEEGCPLGEEALLKVAVERLEWLKARGLKPLEHMNLVGAACSCNLDGMRWLLAEGVRTLDGIAESDLVIHVPLPAIQLLVEEGVLGPPHQVVRSAINQGRDGLPLLRWLVERYGDEVLDAFAAGYEYEEDFRWGVGDAECCGSADMLRFLLERGAIEVEGPGVWRAVASNGSEADLEWLAEVGWPRPADGEPYKAAARNGDARTLRVLRRLGLDWGPPGLGVLAAAVEHGVSLPTLRWMVEEGCPLGEAAMHKAVAELQKGGSPIQADVLEWLEEQGLQLAVIVDNGV